MNINWKLRLQNKTTLTALILAIIAFVYQILGILGIAPGIDQNTLISTCGLIINLLVALGIVVDPTTAGITDSKKVLEYTEPRED